MKRLVIEVPESVSEAIRLPTGEQSDRLRLELAVSLYAQDLISLGKAAELATGIGIPFQGNWGEGTFPAIMPTRS